MQNDRERSGSSQSQSEVSDSDPGAGVGFARHQAIAELGSKALSHYDLSALLEDAAAQVTRLLNVEYSKILELLRDRDALLLRAGVGWKPGYVGRATLPADLDSPFGYALLRSRPVIVDDVRMDTRFRVPPLLIDHGVVSGVHVVIPGKERPFGVLGAHATRRREFSQEEVSFLQVIANQLALAVELRQAEQRFLIAFHASPVAKAIMRLSDGRLFIDVNDRLLELTGYAREEVVGRTSSELGLFVLDGQETTLLDIAQQRNVKRYEDTFRTKSGELRHVITAVTVIEMEGEHRLLGDAIDVTEEKRMEAALQEAREQLDAKAELVLRERNPYELTFREFTVLHLIADGKMDKEIAITLGISALTASKHVANILMKMQAGSRTEAGVRAVREELIT
jgi:PAS domain S-box-containing protein